MSWQRTTHLTRRSLKWMHWTVVLPILLLLLLVASLLFSAPGLRLNLWLAEHLVEGFTVESSSGSLLGGHVLHNIRFQQNNIEFTLQRSALQINSRCLLSLSACVERLSLSGLTLTVLANDSTTNDGTFKEEAPSTAATIPSLWLPFPLTITQFTVDDAIVTTPSMQLTWQGFNTGLAAWGDKIQLSRPTFEQVRLTLPEQPKTPDTVPFRYQPLVLPELTMPMRLFIDHFTVRDATLVQQGRKQHLTELSLSLQWQQQQLQILQLDAFHTDATLHANAAVTTTGPYSLQADVRLLLTNADLNGQQLSLTANGDLATLNLSARSTGPVAATLDATLNLLQPDLPHQLKVYSEKVQWPIVSSQPDIVLQGTEFALHGDLQRSLFSGHTDAIANSAPNVNAEFAGTAGLNGVEIEQLLLKTLDGQITTSAHLDWQNGIQWQGQATVKQVKPGAYWPEYSGLLNGSMHFTGQLTADNSWQIALNQLKLDGTLRDYIFNLDGTFYAEDSSGTGDYQFSTPGLTLRHADNAVSVQGRLQQDWQLQINVDIPDLKQSLNAAGGAVDGQFTLSGPRAQPKFNGALNIDNLLWQDLSITQLSLTSDIWLDNARKYNAIISIDASDAKYQHQLLQQFSLTLNGNEQQHQLNMALISQEHQAELALAGSLSSDQQHWQGELLQAKINSLLGAWQLQKTAPMQFSLQQQRFELAAHCWQQQDSNICLTKPLSISESKFDLALHITEFDLDTLAELMPYGTALNGDINAQLTANWQKNSLPKATLNLTGKAGGFSQQLDKPLRLDWRQLTLSSALANDNINNTLHINFNDESTLNSDVKISGLQQGSRQLQGELKLRQFTLQFLQPLLGELTELSGVLSSDIKLAGNVDTPEVTGDINLSQGRIKGKLAPADIDNAEIALTFAGQEAKMAGLLDTPSGRIDITGSASWQQLSDWQASVNIKGDTLKLQVPQARLQLAPDLTLHASPQLTRLTGTVNIPTATININSLPKEAIELSDDVILVDTQLQPLPQNAKSTFMFETDINVLLGNNVKLSAFGLKTLLNGNLRVRQQAQQPLLVHGDVNLRNGTFRAYGQDLLIRKGKMTFNGPSDQPFLNIEAIRNPENMEDDVIAGIRVNGSVDDLSVAIFSEPAKAQANALSYLLLGRDMESGSGSSGNAITTSLIGMTLASSSKVVGEIGEAFGLQDLTLDTAGAGDDSKVTVSGYLSRDLQVKYGYGIFNAVGEFTLRYRVMRRLYLEAVSGLDEAVDLLYKFEFD
ncbi:translocation/assembly module TamB [Rheinheimera baltica]|uniref:Translocation/assembly module TamB n=2 Tax=Rheinheimera baltica TaxID=67576 RepID=A0ABT9HZ13_9GAMM|nr:translocation/assembly module TamB domain-containing protein [Rheinheimera baltica]MDP5136370.1 translocation/assembly module TamB [Rheinheimera baltica]